MDPINFHCIFKSMESINYLVTYILQNIFFCVHLFLSNVRLFTFPGEFLVLRYVDI